MAATCHFERFPDTSCPDCTTIAEAVRSAAARVATEQGLRAGADLFEESDFRAEASRQWLGRALRAKSSHEAETGHTVPQPSLFLRV
ncbi:MAG: hypothetical protein IT162_17990 [Bryobacterales bacterium]|nr:hypothetical protein [Bryobacterales bacterium]